MATRKYWYHYTTEIMLGLLLMGVLGVSDLPSYTCDVEDYKTLKCLFLKNNDKTCVVPYLGVDGEWDSNGDTCVKNRVYSTWKLTDDYVRLPIDDTKLQGAKISVERPIVMTQAKVTKDLGNIKYIEGYCTSVVEIK